MQLMYVVELSVEGDAAFERIVAHVADWLSGPQGLLAPSDFASNGARELSPARTPNGSYARHGDWEVLETGGTRALKLVVSQAVGTDLELSTRVTVTSIDGIVRFRVGIGRETTNQRLIPVGATDIYQPGILRLLDQDEALTLRASGQLVNGRYIPVKTAVEASAVADILTGEDRLPLALIHVRSTDTWDLARELSRKLLGLVRTVTLNFETSRVIAEAHPEVRVPFGGLAIAWPGLGAPPLTLSAERLGDLGVEEIRRVLAQRLGALAALGNGEDAAWRRVRSLAENARLAELSEQASRAREGGDKDGEISALQQQVEALEEAKAELEAIGEDALQQAETSARLARQLESERNQAREEAEMWQTSYRDLSAGKSVDAPAPQDAWSEIPELVPRADPEATFLAITDAASEHIVFTDRARKSWADIDYPEPADMTEKLVALARAAVALYDGEEKSIPLLDDWLKEQFGLTVALTDQTITKWKRKEMRWLNEFDFEDETLNATPHVKVRDAVKFNECGRIHFALEAKKGRLVVQHVGVKTYQ
jgi:FtsZ-binding cell division protein ZapB